MRGRCPGTPEPRQATRHPTASEHENAEAQAWPWRAGGETLDAACALGRPAYPAPAVGQVSALREATTAAGRPGFPNRSLDGQGFPARAQQAMGRRANVRDPLWSSAPLAHQERPQSPGTSCRRRGRTRTPIFVGALHPDALVCTREPWGDGSSVGEEATVQIQPPSARNPEAV